ncbi:hypothetical protein RF11_03099 [Thelohanellus kitauei]|uniref:Uncharacterized protein n=1 Tax=Thelohanellus kitauei TaxID=669202 RepID=A0A0C2MS72_THEKT|nr:hypothetical protein RF11_03099 [Thelohanellus kitauei]
MKVDPKASDLIIKFEKVSIYDLNPFLEIRCNLVDITDHIEISKCKISARFNEFNSQHDHSSKDEFKIDKITKYEIENLAKPVNIDQGGSKEMIFYITNMTIEPQSYTRICSLKQSTMVIKEIEFTCVNISLSVDTTYPILTSTLNNEVF